MSKEAMILSKVGNKLQLLLLLPVGILETEPVGSFLLALLRKLLSESACIPVGQRFRTSDEAPDCKPVWEPKHTKLKLVFQLLTLFLEPEQKTKVSISAFDILFGT
jgi:hypothetical protein